MRLPLLFAFSSYFHLCVRGDYSFMPWKRLTWGFHSHLCARGDTRPSVAKWMLMFPFTPLRERWPRRKKLIYSYTTFPFALLHKRWPLKVKPSTACVCFNSHLCVRGDWNLTRFHGYCLMFPFTPLRERWPSLVGIGSGSIWVSIHTSAWEVTYYGTAFHECGHSFLFTPLHERWQHLAHWRLDVTVFPFTPLRERWQLRTLWVNINISFYSHLCARGDLYSGR